MAIIRPTTLNAFLILGLVYFLYSLKVPYKTVDEMAEVAKLAQHDHEKHRQQQQQSQKYPSFDWSKVPFQNPIKTLTPLPSGKPKALPKIQFDFKPEDVAAKNIRETRREEVKRQFFKCWRNYRHYAWMHDEMQPISAGTLDHFGGWAATLIDALDTLYLMGFREEFESAVHDIEDIDFGYTELDKVNVFETNIRHLGGLLSAYELSRDKRLLNKAREVGDMLYHAFDTPNHMPITRWQFRAGGEGKPQAADEQVLLAEIGSMSMEFTRLSQLTEDPKYYDVVDRITALMAEQQDKTQLPGMWPLLVNARNADFKSDTGFTLASMADSTYEYLSKQYLLLGGLDDRYRSMHTKAMDTAAKNVLFRPSTPDNHDMLVAGLVRANGEDKQLDPMLQHLACYTGGMYALGGKLFENGEHVNIGRKLANTCVWAYKASPAGIMPESSHLLPCKDPRTCTWDENAWHEGIRARTAESEREKDPLKNIANMRLPPGFTSIEDRRYLLRPEAIESIFIMYRITGERHWQAAAWDMWTAIQRATDTDIGNSALRDVSADSPPREDSMESFWMAETLKYFFLIFCDPDYVSLDEFVFNTEAHPFRIPRP